ncbi:MAG: dihydropteroate synthase [Kiritimatiellae bacterium]|nr:dihydropteroate synthase [Kiritimatiellia bacterium]
MRAEVMGIVNVTPDSFSDGGKYHSANEAVRRALNMIGEGAGIIDIGGESTRPDAEPIGWKEEWARVEPVLNGLKGRTGGVKISIDTYHPETAARAVASGASIINCVYSAPVVDMLRIVDENPGTELVLPGEAWKEGGSLVAYRDRVYIDPMIGFGTDREEDMSRLQSIGALAREARVLVGVSRKRIVKKLTGEKVTGKNLGGNLALALWCMLQGASVVRVHDVRETVQAFKVVDVMNR